MLGEHLLIKLSKSPPIIWGNSTLILIFYFLNGALVVPGTVVGNHCLRAMKIWPAYQIQWWQLQSSTRARFWVLDDSDCDKAQPDVDLEKKLCLFSGDLNNRPVRYSTGKNGMLQHVLGVAVLLLSLHLFWLKFRNAIQRPGQGLH